MCACVRCVCVRVCVSVHVCVEITVGEIADMAEHIYDDLQEKVIEYIGGSDILKYKN